MIRILAIILLLFSGISACFGGIKLVLDPTGAAIELPIEWIRFTPFPDYLIPGLILLIVNGIGSLVAGFMTMFRVRGYPVFIALIGSALIVWIVVQMLMTRLVHPLQLAYAGVGIVLIVLGIGEWRKLAGGGMMAQNRAATHARA